MGGSSSKPAPQVARGTISDIGECATLIKVQMKIMDNVVFVQNQKWLKNPKATLPAANDDFFSLFSQIVQF